MYHRMHILWYSRGVAIEWTDSVDRHGIDRQDALHALVNHVFLRPEFDEPRRAGSGRPDLYIGPQRQCGAPLLEVMVERVSPRGLVVFHVMEARAKFLALMDDEEDVR